MNFLAHLHVAEATPASRLGNLLGDFVKGYPGDARFPPAVWRGIVEHRAVDAYTDRNPHWQRSRSLLPQHLRRLAGIVVDIYYDYLLHRHWATFEPFTEVESFVESVHRDLGGQRAMLPVEIQDVFRRLVAENWLLGYATLPGIRLTLERVVRRAPRLSGLFAAADILEGHLPDLEEHFLAFYPELSAHVIAVRTCAESALKKEAAP
jgi:acyl carrier protein phosphodiesterase